MILVIIRFCIGLIDIIPEKRSVENTRNTNKYPILVPLLSRGEIVVCKIGHKNINNIDFSHSLYAIV
jgi:hypothetical protein